LATHRPQAGHRRAVRRRLPRALRRKTLEEAGLLSCQRKTAPSRPRRADRQGFQKNFSRTLSAHLDGLPHETPLEIWFQDEARIGQKNGQVRQWDVEPGPASGRPALRERLSVPRHLPGARRRRSARLALGLAELREFAPRPHNSKSPSPAPFMVQRAIAELTRETRRATRHNNRR
jgi:hypothetical protein